MHVSQVQITDDKFSSAFQHFDKMFVCLVVSQIPGANHFADFILRIMCTKSSQPVKNMYQCVKNFIEHAYLEAFIRMFQNDEIPSASVGAINRKLSIWVSYR